MCWGCCIGPGSERTRWSVMLLTGGTPTLNPHHTAPRNVPTKSPSGTESGELIEAEMAHQWSRQIEREGAHIDSLMLSSCRRVDRTGMGHTLLVEKLLLVHTFLQERSGWGRQVIIRTASAMRQPVDRVRPHPDLKGLPVSAGPVSSFPSLRANRMASTTATQNGNPTELEISAQPTSHRLTGCGPYSQHHPSQPVMR